jgi:hypothetical protein
MLRTEWNLASHWIPHHVSKYRWLVHRHLEQVHASLDYWSDKELDQEPGGKTIGSRGFETERTIDDDTGNLR